MTDPAGTPSGTPDQATEASIPPVPTVSEIPVDTPGTGAALGFNGRYDLQSVNAAVEGFIAGEVGDVENAPFTVTTVCAPTCVATLTAPNGGAWTATENAGAFTLDTRLINDCSVPAGAQSAWQLNGTLTPTAVDGGRIQELVGTVVFTETERCPGQTEPPGVLTQAVTLRLLDS